MIAFIMAGTVISYIIKALPYIFAGLFSVVLIMAVAKSAKHDFSQTQESGIPPIQVGAPAASVLHAISEAQKIGWISKKKVKELVDRFRTEGPSEDLIDTVNVILSTPKMPLGVKKKHIITLSVLLPLAILVSFFVAGVTVPEPAPAPVETPVARAQSKPAITASQATPEMIRRFKSDCISLYNELIDSKKDPLFWQRGFGAGNPKAHSWINKANLVNDRGREEKTPFPLRVVPGDLIQMGLQYKDTRGQETEFTRYADKAIRESLSSR